jgi:hypothetical protein
VLEDRPLAARGATPTRRRINLIADFSGAGSAVYWIGVEHVDLAHQLAARS